MGNNKIRQIHLRLSEEEYKSFQEKSKKYGGISQMIRKLVGIADDVYAKNHYDILLEMTEMFQQHNTEINRVGVNINQAVRQINIQALKNSLNTQTAQNDLMPYLNKYYRLLIDLEKGQKQLLKKFMRKTTLN